MDEDQSILERGSPPPPLFVEDQPSAEQTTSPPPFQTDIHEIQATHEIRDQFGWLVDLLGQNQSRGWGTAYRDFADVSVLLRAVRGLGMVERVNNRISNEIFHASTGDYALSLLKFIDLMSLGHSTATWGNKLTMYFWLKTL